MIIFSHTPHLPISYTSALAPSSRFEVDPLWTQWISRFTEIAHGISDRFNGFYDPEYYKLLQEMRADIRERYPNAFVTVLLDDLSFMPPGLSKTPKLCLATAALYLLERSFHGNVQSDFRQFKRLLRAYNRLTREPYHYYYRDGNFVPNLTVYVRPYSTPLAILQPLSFYYDQGVNELIGLNLEASELPLNRSWMVALDLFMLGAHLDWNPYRGKVDFLDHVVARERISYAIEALKQPRLSARDRQALLIGFFRFLATFAVQRNDYWGWIVDRPTADGYPNQSFRVIEMILVANAPQIQAWFAELLRAAPSTEGSEILQGDPMLAGLRWHLFWKFEKWVETVPPRTSGRNPLDRFFLSRGSRQRNQALQRLLKMDGREVKNNRFYSANRAKENIRQLREYLYWLVSYQQPLSEFYAHADLWDPWLSDPVLQAI